MTQKRAAQPIDYQNWIETSIKFIKLTDILSLTLLFVWYNINHLGVFFKINVRPANDKTLHRFPHLKGSLIKIALHESNQSTNLFISWPFYIPSFKLLLHAFNQLDCDQFIFFCCSQVLWKRQELQTLTNSSNKDQKYGLLGRYKSRRSVILTRSRRIRQ